MTYTGISVDLGLDSIDSFEKLLKDRSTILGKGFLNLCALLFSLHFHALRRLIRRSCVLVDHGVGGANMELIRE